MKLPKLYARTSNGSIQVWQIEFDNGQYFTTEGILNGKMTTSLPTICEGKNVGRSNETSAEDQAEKEARSKWKKKIESGYFEDIKDIDNKIFFEPMLAKVWGDYSSEIKYPVFVQPKLDGMRCILKSDGMWSRNGKKILSAPHIYDAFKNLFLLQPDLIIDGELYAHKFNNDFNKIISLAKKSKPTAADLAESKKHLEYWIYDLPSHNGVFSERYNELTDIHARVANKSIVLVPSSVCQTENEVDMEHSRCIADGYEGSIIRLDAPYENKRTKSLLKRKDFIDQEFEIIGVVDGIGNRTGTAGAFTCKTPEGKTFDANIKGTNEFRAAILENKKDYIGKLATVKYFNLTPDNIPRFPVVTAIRDYE